MDLINNNNGNEFLRQLFQIIVDEKKLVGNADFLKQHHKKLLEFKYPDELEKSLDLVIGREGGTESILLDICRQIIDYSVKTGHPNHYNLLYGGTEQFSLSGSWLTEALNTIALTWETAPVFTVIDKYMINYFGKIIGYEEQDIDGMFCPGGTIANTYGMVAARHHAFPQLKQKGMTGMCRIVIFVSEEAHYSFDKSAIWLGMGTDSVIKVKTDERGRMIPEELRKSILKAKSEGMTPFMVCATSGTTVLGAFDPLPPIADICQEYGLWFHVDAALGGVWLLSKKHRHLLAGVERADSVIWALSKTMSVHQQCNLFLTKHRNILFECHSLGTDYLFQKDKYYDSSYDWGDKSFQCGRKVESLKVWLQFKAYGELGIESAVDNVYDMAQYLTGKLRENTRFKLVLDEFESNSVCFWYLPPDICGTEQNEETLSKVAPIIKERMMKTGSVLLSYQPHTSKGWPNFFRLNITCFPKRTTQDMDYVIQQIEELGKDIKF